MTTHTLHALILTLAPTAAGTVRATQGHQAHAAFLRAVRQVDPELAAALHDPVSQVRPFTVSGLLGLGLARDGHVRLAPEQELGLRVTILDDQVWERFMARFMRADLRPVIRVGRMEFLIRQIIATPEGHPGAGYTTWAELAGGVQPADEITLQFRSPTAFGFGQKAWGKKTVLLPQPELVFGSLIRSWNGLAPAGLALDRDALRAYLDEHVVVKRLDGLETQMLRFRRSLQVGFVGRVTYGLMSQEGMAPLQLAALADFAFYAGVGMKTTMGMGQCHWVGKRGERNGAG